MKQVIRLTEKELHQLVNESVVRLINEEKDEALNWFNHKDTPRPTERRPQQKKQISMAPSSAPTAIDNYQLNKEMSNPYGRIKNRINTFFNDVTGKSRKDLTNQLNQKTAEYDEYRNTAGQYGLDQRIANREKSSAKVAGSKGYNNKMAKAYALSRDIKQDIQQDIPQYGLNQQDVNKALEISGNEFNQNPASFGVQQEPQQEQPAQQPINFNLGNDNGNTIKPKANVVNGRGKERSDAFKQLGIRRQANEDFIHEAVQHVINSYLR